MSEMKVHDLLAKVAKYSGTIKLITVPFTEIQENIRDKCPEELFTLIMRRYMMRISNILAEKEGCEAIVTRSPKKSKKPNYRLTATRL